MEAHRLASRHPGPGQLFVLSCSWPSFFARDRVLFFLCARASSCRSQAWFSSFWQLPCFLYFVNDDPPFLNEELLFSGPCPLLLPRPIFFRRPARPCFTSSTRSRFTQCPPAPRRTFPSSVRPPLKYILLCRIHSRGLARQHFSPPLVPLPHLRLRVLSHPAN